MKLRKLLMCLAASIAVCGMTGIHTYAAETTVVVNKITATVLELAGATEENNANTQEANTEENATAQDVIAAEIIKDTTNEKDTTSEKDTTNEVKDESKDEIKNDVKEETKEKAAKKKEKKAEAKTVAKAQKAEKVEKAKSYTNAEVRLLAALIFCEAGGEPYAGKLAVGVVVVNRKESKTFPDSIKSVIYQSSQFGPARNGSLSRALSAYDKGGFNSESEKACIKAAKEALSGVKQVNYRSKKINMEDYLFFSGRVNGARLSIANHQFK